MSFNEGLTLVLGTILILSGFAKFGSLRSFRDSVATWPIPSLLHGPTAVALPAAELALGTALCGSNLPGYPSSWPLSLAAALFAVFAVAQAWLLTTDTKAECGCFGKPSAVSVATVVRAGVLALVATAAWAIQ